MDFDPWLKRQCPSSKSAIRIGYCFAQTITAFAPSQLAPVVPSMRTAAPPAQ